MLLSIIVAIYTLGLIYAFYFGGIGIGSIVLILGILMVALIPVFQKNKIDETANLIKNNVKEPFININKAPWYVLAELPHIERVEAKRIVYIRKHYGAYKSFDDFFEKMNIKSEFRGEISQFIFI